MTLKGDNLLESKAILIKNKLTAEEKDSSVIEVTKNEIVLYHTIRWSKIITIMMVSS